jgi:hypothetical protein
MKKAEPYRRRAIECLAFARNARTDEERRQMLIMANTLERLALDRERRTVKVRTMDRE